MRPIIGVTTNQEQNYEGLASIALLRVYIDALVQAGGIPILIPSSLLKETHHALVKHLGGVLFSGGGDVAPDRFGEDSNPSIRGVDSERDSCEISILNYLIKDGIPFLGICRGFQIINVGLGGTLYTHIKDQLPGAIKHDYFPDYPHEYLAHKITVVGDTILAKVLGGTDLNVNSRHHQGVKTISSGLKPTAYAPDGLIEAIELPDHPFGIAVQWHPEWLTNQDNMRRLFRGFLEAASKYNEK